MIEAMAQVHMTEAEVARDLHDVLAKVQQGVESWSSKTIDRLRLSVRRCPKGGCSPSA
jgi:hypothetical protein